ncbi:Arginine--tRNA ligase [Porphyridium purpureum]|uniref:arginine--tRNA ligase n=1 Tax=Porphyridium purpureum TaxID=35688 RepID=A0A5J4YTX5_PORPP|nr:Arginine--tRNA ligase [Porphyridium purpureum]|eukprot:POR1090..scf229_5
MWSCAGFVAAAGSALHPIPSHGRTLSSRVATAAAQTVLAPRLLQSGPRNHAFVFRPPTSRAQARAVGVVTYAAMEGNNTDLDPAMLQTKKVVVQRVVDAIRAAFGSEIDPNPMVTPATKEEFGDFQCNAAMGLAKSLKKKPRDVATAIVEKLDIADLCVTPPEIAGPGFINLKLTDEYVKAKMKHALQDKERLGIAKRDPAQRIIVDFSSPNIAKEMHVGHLRSTIIGDCLCRILEFLGHDVLRLNHVGDWGTQFGMLILYLREVAPEALVDGSDLDLGDLVVFYKKAKARFDEDPEFQESARKEVVKLQAGDEESLRGWKTLCNQSRIEFNRVYDILDVKLEERGESFYNPFLKQVVTDLQEKQLAVENEGAQCVFLEGFTSRDGSTQPLLVQKSDGGYMYSTTDLAAIRHRTHVEKATRVLYVTDVGQSTHFEQVFQVARRAEFYPPSVSLEHVPFGLVQGEDGKKFKTRSGDTVRLRDLLDEAVVRCKADYTRRMEEEGRAETSEYVEEVSKVVGIAAVKYADLKNNRVSNYRFSYDKMLTLTGNTAPYMLYAYARIQGIYRKGGIDITSRVTSLDLKLDKPEEMSLVRLCLRFDQILEVLETDLKPNFLCEYMYEVASKFNAFYENCSVLNAESERVMESRLAICDLTARTLALSFSLLGIKTLERL